MRTATAFLALLGVAAGASCSAIPTCLDDGSCSAFADGGTATEGGADVVAPPDCDLSKSPKDSPACLDDAVGVFVSPSGDDGATGKKTSPAKSIGKGVELAVARGLPRVYVCEGTYDIAAEIKSAVRVYGGLSCSWAYNGAKPRLAPTRGIALRVTRAAGAVFLEDIEIVGAADKSTLGDSAIAVFVSESANVAFRNSVLRAGDASTGSKGVARSNYTLPATAGGLSNTSAAGAGPTCTCVDSTKSKGGAGATGAGLGVENGSSIPAAGAPNSGTTGASSCTAGGDGASGNAGAAGASPVAPGSIASSGWSAASGGPDAPNGAPGQGGGGGGARVDLNLGGGGGACGGCGGAGGTSGGGGGSSFALLSFNSNVTVEGGTLATGAGGTGGEGGPGQAGQSGGALGAGVCNGGAGGNGAGGSGGGGGAGGHSAPIAFVGAEPRVTAATITPGTKGGGGNGGTPGAGPGNAGVAGSVGPDGKAQGTLPL